MHKYLRAVGFSKIKNHNEVHDLILDVIKKCNKQKLYIKFRRIHACNVLQRFHQQYGYCGMWRIR